MRVPEDALYAAQTQRAVDNFPISGIRFSRTFIRALGLIKRRRSLRQFRARLPPRARRRRPSRPLRSEVEGQARPPLPARHLPDGLGHVDQHERQQVIANLASVRLGSKVHPNDHVNMGQSSNDVIPTAIHVAAYLEVAETLLPGLRALQRTLEKRRASLTESSRRAVRT
ncbi:MAG: lyase family protein [Bryobacterales bacterium]